MRPGPAIGSLCSSLSATTHPGRALRNRFSINSPRDSLPWLFCLRQGGPRGMEGRVSRQGRLDSLVQGGFGQPQLIWELGGCGRMQGRWRARGATVADKRDTDERVDNIGKAYDPRSDLLLLEGEENNMQH